MKNGVWEISVVLNKASSRTKAFQIQQVDLKIDYRQAWLCMWTYKFCKENTPAGTIIQEGITKE